MLVKIILKNIYSNKLLACITSFVLSLSIIFFVFLNFTYQSINKIILNEDMWSWSVNKFILSPIGWSFLASSLWIEYDLEENYKKIKNDKNIKESFGIYKFEIPITADIYWLSTNFNTDMLMFATDIWLKSSWEKIPLAISPMILNLYNSQVASKRMPKVNEKMLKSLWVRLEFWKSSFTKFKKSNIKEWIIVSLNSDFPLLGITMDYEQAKKIIKSVDWWSLKLIQIIWESKNSKYLDQLKNQHKWVEIKTPQDAQVHANRKIKALKDTINIIKYLTFFIIWSFLVSLIFNLYNNNKRNLKVFYYHGAWFLTKSMLIFWEIFLYFTFATILSLVFVWIFNHIIIDVLNVSIKEAGFFNLSLEQISYLELSKVLFGLLIFLLTVFLVIFKYKEKNNI